MTLSPTDDSSALSEGDMHLVEGYNAKLVNSMAHQKDMCITELIGKNRDNKRACSRCGRSRLDTQPS